MLTDSTKLSSARALSNGLIVSATVSVRMNSFEMLQMFEYVVKVITTVSDLFDAAR